MDGCEPVWQEFDFLVSDPGVGDRPNFLVSEDRDEGHVIQCQQEVGEA